MIMNRSFLYRRSCKKHFNSDSFRSTIGCDARATDFVHQCLTNTMTANDFSPSAHLSTVDIDFRLQHCRTLDCQRRKHHLPFQNLSSQFHQQHQQQQHQQLQVRHFIFDSRKARRSKTKKDPFKVLKVPKESLYKDVKAKFLRIAMNNHPDMHTEGLSEKQQKTMRDKFIEARMAFELLEEDLSDGKAVLIEDKIDREDNFDSWFKGETGLKNPFDVDIDPETMKEVAEMTEKLGGKQGMDRDGGMWALARMVTSAVKAGGDAASILRLESGDTKPRPGTNPDGSSLRRPRKR